MALFVLLLLVFFDVVTLVEFVDPSGCGDKLLLSGIERMAIRAGVNLDFFGSRTGFERISAGTAGDSYLIIFRVDILFHRCFLLLP
jgi:hypothetical protein